MTNVITGMLDCEYCMEELVGPVILPCGETICSRHEAEFKRSKCMYCDKKHSLNKTDHYPPNKIIQNLLDAQITSLDLGEIHSKAVIMLQKLKNKILLHEETLSEPKFTISNYFYRLRDSVNLEKRRLLKKINDCSEKLLLEIESLEKECEENLLNLNPVMIKEEESLLAIKQNLIDWENEVNSLRVNERLWSSVEQKAKEQFDDLEKRSSDLKTEFLLGKKKKLEIEASYFDVRSKFEDFIDFER
jgi:hypothetical protein